MFLLASRNLLVHKGRFLLAIIGIACSVVLVLFLMGLYAGWRENMSSYLRHVHADVWVGSERRLGSLPHPFHPPRRRGEQVL